MHHAGLAVYKRCSNVPDRCTLASLAVWLGAFHGICRSLASQLFPDSGLSEVKLTGRWAGPAMLCHRDRPATGGTAVPM